MLQDWEGIARIVSWCLGWIYFTSWSLSFYPQPLLCWKQKSTRGLTVDFPLLNVLGFTSYTLSTVCFLFSPLVRRQYAVRHPAAPEPTVRFNDFAFALHGMILCFILYSQFWHRLWNFESVNSQRASSATLGIFYGCFLGVALAAVLVVSFNGDKETVGSWAEIDIMYALSYVKLIVTFIKYIPQAWHNYRIKSTAGWAISMVLFDFVGGILSLLQLFIDSALERDWSGISGNPVKFGLSIVSLFFDVIFLLQHYVLYKDKKLPEDTAERGSEREPLLT